MMLCGATNVSGLATKATLILRTDSCVAVASVDAKICGVRRIFRLRWDWALVATAAMLSCVAWAFYQPAIAIGILMLAGLIDMVLYTMMGDMLVCYRCGARHRRTTINDEHPRFDLETAERYRQQDLRQHEATH